MRGRTIFVGAMNDVAIGGGRQELPRRLDDLLTRVHLVPFEPSEVRRIAHGVCSEAFARAEDAAWAREPLLLDAAIDLVRCLPLEVPGIDATFNLRTLQNLAAVLDSIPWGMIDAARHSLDGFEYQRSGSRGRISIEKVAHRPQREYLQLCALMLVFTCGCSPRFAAAAEVAVARRFLGLRRRRQQRQHRGGGVGCGGSGSRA